MFFPDPPHLNHPNCCDCPTFFKGAHIARSKGRFAQSRASPSHAMSVRTHRRAPNPFPYQQQCSTVRASVCAVRGSSACRHLRHSGFLLPKPICCQHGVTWLGPRVGLLVKLGSALLHNEGHGGSAIKLHHQHGVKMQSLPVRFPFCSRAEQDPAGGGETKPKPNSSIILTGRADARSCSPSPCSQLPRGAQLLILRMPV